MKITHFIKEKEKVGNTFLVKKLVEEMMLRNKMKINEIGLNFKMGQMKQVEL